MAGEKSSRKGGQAAQIELVRLESLLAQGNGDEVLHQAAALATVYPRSAGVHLVIGAANMRLGRFADAGKAFARAARIEPRNAAAFSNLGLALKEQGRIDDAVKALRRAVLANPRLAAAHYNLGNVLRENGRPAESVDPYLRAIALQPDNAVAQHNLGVALYQIDDLERAASASAAAIRHRPSYAAAHANLGNALFGLRRLEEAANCYRTALKLEPGNARYHFNFGRILRDLFAFDEATSEYRRAIALDGEFASAHLNLGLLSLLRGDFATGLREYEWRKGRPGTPPDEMFAAVPWRGAEQLAGHSILLHAEQGFGDTLQFVRYADLVRRRGARVIVAVQPGLIPLMQGSYPDLEVVSHEARPPETTYHSALLSLPLAFSTDSGSIPAQRQYLSADPARAAAWAERLGDAGFRIGICWQGSTERIDKWRSFPLACFAGLANMPGVRLISLHKGAGEEQLANLAEFAVETLGARFDPPGEAFVDTAAVMMHCDLIITSDTAIAHLAGALGRPVWVVLKHLPDWRWLLDRSDSPWYPTMRLFRQGEAGNWSGPFAEVETAVSELLAQRRATNALSQE